MHLQGLKVALQVLFHLTLDVVAFGVDAAGDLVQPLNGVLRILAQRTSLVGGLSQQLALISDGPGDGLVPVTPVEEDQAVGTGQLPAVGAEGLQLEVRVNATAEHQLATVPQSQLLLLLFPGPSQLQDTPQPVVGRVSLTFMGLLAEGA